MKKILIYGLVAGMIVSLLMTINITFCYRAGNFDSSMFIGYGSMILAFSMIFVGVKNYRDKTNGGQITFAKALQYGVYISLVASTIYVITWAVNYHFFVPDFMEKYCAHTIQEINQSSIQDVEKAAKIADISNMKEMYKNPIFFTLFTYMEILPVGVIMSLISAGVLRKK